ncbi:hypothetical protein KKG72_12415 [bacterium]|nr:hypothetical protein [bacterium]MBU1994978.1 hypothetical protein [bacterium]
MNFSFLSLLFNKKKKSLKLPDSLLVKKLKEVSASNGLSVYENITIYHHAQSFFIPLLILDTSRGIYLFEYKEWSYNDLKNASVEKAANQSSAEENLAFEKSHDFIRQKFNEITHSNGVPLFNFLLMENLNTFEYDHLNNSFKKLLPQEWIMFNDSSQEDILNKLKQIPLSKEKLPTVDNIMGNLLVQYLILSKDNSIHLAGTEQIVFIESEIFGHQTLSAKVGSGKTSSILLKALLEKLKNPHIKILIIEPTVLACDILKQKLINTIEYAIIEVDATSIEIITPTELLNKHLRKLNKPELKTTAYVENILMNKKFNAADLILCDDSDLLENDFINYLQHIQKNAALLFVKNQNIPESTYTFRKNFKQNNKTNIFKKTLPHAKALQILSNLLEIHKSKDVLVVSNTLSKEKLYDDLKFFIRDKAVLLDSSQNLIDQKLDNLLLSTYNHLSGISAKFVILLDIDSATNEQASYAINLGEDTVFILYDEESDYINELRDKFESNKD